MFAFSFSGESDSDQVFAESHGAVDLEDVSGRDAGFTRLNIKVPISSPAPEGKSAVSGGVKEHSSHDAHCYGEAGGSTGQLKMGGSC